MGALFSFYGLNWFVVGGCWLCMFGPANSEVVLELGFIVVVCLSAAVGVGQEVAAFDCDVVV